MLVTVEAVIGTVITAYQRIEMTCGTIVLWIFTTIFNSSVGIDFLNSFEGVIGQFFRVGSIMTVQTFGFFTRDGRQEIEKAIWALKDHGLVIPCLLEYGVEPFE